MREQDIHLVGAPGDPAVPQWLQVKRGHRFLVLNFKYRPKRSIIVIG